MSEPVRFARIAQAYSANTVVYYRQRSLADSPPRDTVHISREAEEKSREYMMKLKEESSSEQSSPKLQDGDDPDILYLPTNATRDQIRRAYLGAIKQYHPDKFAGLCPEFRKLAEEKCKEIILAYQKLTSM